MLMSYTFVKLSIYHALSWDILQVNLIWNEYLSISTTEDKFKENNRVIKCFVCNEFVRNAHKLQINCQETCTHTKKNRAGCLIWDIVYLV
jgi:hypothetical protein